MKTSLIRLVLILAVMLGGVGTLTAQADLNTVRAQMRERLPQIDSLKAAGAIGEDNRGFVAVREAQGNAAEVVSAENADRRVVYDSIAKQTGSTADAVGKARARQIATQSAAGVWVQKEDGSWYRK